MQEIYRGAYSTVFDAGDKIVKNEVIRNPNDASAELFFTLESDHPNIVRGMSADIKRSPEGVISYTMSLPKGAPLDKIDRLTNQQLVKVLYDVLCGLRSLHVRGRSVHSDVKPPNVLVFAVVDGKESPVIRPSSKVVGKLADLGQVTHKNSTGVHGTKGYYFSDDRGRDLYLRDPEMQDLFAFCIMALNMIFKHDARLVGQSYFGLEEAMAQYDTKLDRVGALRGLAIDIHRIMEAMLDEPDFGPGYYTAALTGALMRYADKGLDNCNSSPGEKIERLGERWASTDQNYAREDVMGMVRPVTREPSLESLREMWCPQDSNHSRVCALMNLQHLRDQVMVSDDLQEKVLELRDELEGDPNAAWIADFAASSQIPDEIDSMSPEFFSTLDLFLELLPQ